MRKCVEIVVFKSEPRQKRSLNKALVRLCSFATVTATSSQMESLIASLPFLDLCPQISCSTFRIAYLRVFRTAYGTDVYGNASEG